MREELARQHAHESELRENRGHMVRGGHSSGPAVPERSAAMAFMEQLPPGMAEANERQKGVKQGTKAEAQAEKFPILQNAPRQGDFTKDLAVHHRPFGVDLQHTKCSRCGQWGHRLGDRECPMRDQNPLDPANKERMDPMAGRVQVRRESSCGPASLLALFFASRPMSSEALLISFRSRCTSFFTPARSSEGTSGSVAR